MPDIACHYTDGHVEYRDYSNLWYKDESGKVQWNQPELRKLATPQRPSEVFCLCRDKTHENVKMHFVEKPVGSGRYFLANNPDQSASHAAHCPKRSIDNGTVVLPPSETDRAVRYHDRKDGTYRVEVRINPFAGGIREEDDALTSDGDVEKTDSPAAAVNREETDANKVRHQRAQAKFGGLIREWYLMGRKRAVTKKTTRFLARRNVLYEMVQSLREDEVSVLMGKTRSLKKVAVIPNRDFSYRSDGIRKIMLGFYAKQSTDNGILRIGIRGLSGIWWVEVPHVLRNRVTKPDEKRLIAVRVIRKEGRWRLTHAPFTVVLSSPDAMWCESSYEAEAYGWMVKRGLSVDKPLRVREDLGGMRPDFVLTDFEPEVVVEVYGRVNDPEYNEHKRIKREKYLTYQREGLIRYLEWDLEDKSSRQNFLTELDQYTDFKKTLQRGLTTE